MALRQTADLGCRWGGEKNDTKSDAKATDLGCRWGGGRDGTKTDNRPGVPVGWWEGQLQTWALVGWWEG